MDGKIEVSLHASDEKQTRPPTFEVKFDTGDLNTLEIVTLTVDLKALADQKDLGSAILYGKMHEFTVQWIQLLKLIRDRSKTNAK